MRVAVTGANGLIGRALTAELAADGHDVVAVVRRPTRPAEVAWDPASGRLDPAAFARCGAVVHLAGAGIGDRRWSAARRAEILESREQSTMVVANAVAALAGGEGVAGGGGDGGGAGGGGGGGLAPTLVCASAVGFYGDRGDEELTEASSTGAGFLAEVCRRWEAATAPAEVAGARVVHLRSGVVLAAQGGALTRQARLFRLGLGGRIASGRQWLSWIALADEVGAIRHVIATPELSGAVNAVAPNPVTNAAFTAALARALHRPAVLPAPKTALRLVLGRGLTDELLLTSQRAVPTRLLASGYAFRSVDIDHALGDIFARSG